MNTKQITDCTAVVLCGGKSSRMGFDKALLQANGEYVVLETIRILKNIFTDVILVTNHSGKFPDEFLECEVVEDYYSERGPLGGLVTALEYVKSNKVFLMACDMPYIDVELIQKMVPYTETHDIVLIKQKDVYETLFAFYHVSCLPVFQQQLKGKDWRIRKEFGRFNMKIVRDETNRNLANVNTPKELILWKNRGNT